MAILSGQEAAKSDAKSNTKNDTKNYTKSEILNDTTEVEEELKKSFYNGLRVDLDIAPALTTFLNKGETYSFEAAVQAELFKKYFPVFEIGFGGANKTTTSDIHFKGNGMFYRLGMDFNIIKSKEEEKFRNYFLVGARLGYNYQAYNVDNVMVGGGLWGDGQLKNYEQSKSSLWFEIAAGLRVEVFKNAYIGWNMRIRNLITKDKDGEIKPLYIPGYGTNDEGSVWGFNYLIGYKF